MTKRKKSDKDKNYKYQKETDDISVVKEVKESKKNKKKVPPKKRKKNWNDYLKENNLDQTKYMINIKKTKEEVSYDFEEGKQNIKSEEYSKTKSSNSEKNEKKVNLRN